MNEVAGERRLTVDLDGRPVALRLRRNARARRLVLRIDPETDGAVISLPPGVPAKSGIAFARARAG